MSYTVFARKYRPQTFDEVVGQEHITQTLKNAIEQNRLAHAYIFVGPRGTGKTSMARILAKALNCVHGPTVNPCGVCDVCKEIAAGNSMDVLEFDAASNTQVDKIREIIIENVKYAPSHGKYKLYIVDEVHMLSASSFNALLKTLEEPPAHVKFVFATTDPQKVPTTILSRCQRFDLKRIPTALVREHLRMIAGKEGIALTPAAAEAVARGADGGMRDAESMLDQLVAFCGNEIDEPDVLRVFGFTAQQTVSQLCEHLLAHDASAALRLVHEEGEAGRDLMRLLGDLISHLRNLLVAKADTRALQQELSAETAVAVTEQAARIDMARLLDLIEQFAGAEGRMKWAPNKKMHLEVAVIRAIQTLSQATLSEVLDTLAAMRGGTPLPAAPSALPKNAPVSQPARKSEVQIPKPANATERVSPPANHLDRSVTGMVESGAQSRAERSEPDSRRLPEEPARPSESSPVQEPTAPISNVAPKSEGGSNTKLVETLAPASDPSTPLDVAALWSAVITRVRKDRPLIANCVEAGTLLEVTNGFAVVGFPPDHTFDLEQLDMPNQRRFIEAILGELAGQALAIKCVKREGLVVAPPPAPVQPAAPPDPMEEFKDDPLIRKALELFRAEIQPA